MHWIMLLLAGIFEVTWACTMKLSDGFSRALPSVITVIGYILSAIFLAMALKKLPLGTAYAMWTGFGIVGTTLIGALFLNETITLAQVICIILIAAGVVGLKVLS